MAVSAQSNLLPAFGPSREEKPSPLLCFTAPEAQGTGSQIPGSPVQQPWHGDKYSVALNKKTSKKIFILYDILGNLGYIIKIHSITGSLFGWEDHESG